MKTTYEFAWLEDEYLGGNIVAIYGQLADGTYFYATDADEGVWILNSNPTEMLEYWEDDYWYTWLEDHEIYIINGSDDYRFWIAAFKYCKSTGNSIYTYGNLDAAIREFKQYL